jgi:hypothetical protein
MTKEPVMLTMIVPQGNVSPIQFAMAVAIQYRATPPIALPIAIQKEVIAHPEFDCPGRTPVMAWQRATINRWIRANRVQTIGQRPR